jgi:hypothetical protein
VEIEPARKRKFNNIQDIGWHSIGERYPMGLSILFDDAYEMLTRGNFLLPEVKLDLVRALLIMADSSVW